MSPDFDWRTEAARRGAPVPTDAAVTAANWRTYPYLIAGVQRAHAFVPSRPILPAETPGPLPVEPMDIDHLTIPDDNGDDLSWAQFLDRTHTDALAVVHGGRLVFEHYANGMTPATAHQTFSVTKSVLGLLAEQMISSGELEEDAPARSLVPELAEGAFGSATVRGLLDMRDGAPFDENYADVNAQIHRYSKAYWGDGPEGADGVLAALGRLPSGPAREERPFSYRTPAADVLGWMVRRASGRSLAELIQERLWRPIGAEHEAHLLLDRAGDEIAGTGFGATLRDVARLAAMLLGGGRMRGRVVMPADALARIADGGCRLAFAAGGQPSRPGWSYRSQWWSAHDGHGTISALGVFGQRMIVSPGRDLALVRFGSHPIASNAGTDAIHARAMDALARRLNDLSVRGR